MAKQIERSWLEANQHHLSAAIAGIRYQLEQHAARSANAGAVDRSASDAIHESTVIAQSMSQPPALDVLTAALALTQFEQHILVLCAGVELDSSFSGVCGRALGDTQRAYPTFGLALAALAGAHWSALLPDGPLRYWHLLEFGVGGSPSAPLTTRPLRIDERVLHYLTGLPHADERLAVLRSPVPTEDAVVATHRSIADHVVTSWQGTVRTRAPVIALYGSDASSARAIATLACRSCGWRPYLVSERLIPSAAADLHLLARLLEREVKLDAAAVLIDCDGSAEPGRNGALGDLLDRTDAPFIVISRERQQLGRRPTVSYEVSKPTPHEQRAIWNTVLSVANRDLAASVDAVTAHFSLNVPEIQSAAAEARADDGGVSGRALWNACRHQSRGRLDDLAQRMSSSATLDDVVLPDLQKETLRDIVMHVRHRAIVHESWGFGGRNYRGVGISVLFAGASGTGKTMSAEVLAEALELDLYRIDLSSVVSKYIGETEKNLRRIFDAADAGGVILLFDEADALFGKRSEVKDSHDRYANIEVSYLLQRIESYRGLAILTTNMRSALDTAFLRRIRFIVQFPFPDAAQRAEIWRKVFPRETPTANLDVERLAQLSVAGGSIRNVALSAAFLAADTNEPLGMQHLLRAARSEYAKLEKALTDAEVVGWM